MPRMLRTILVLSIIVLGLAVAGSAQQPATSPSPSPSPAPALAHFHHLHLNATDPAADIAFYTAKFDCEKARFNGALDAVWAQKSWMFFNKVSEPPKSEITSTIWHWGWGA